MALRVSLIQTDIVWENKAENLRNIERKIVELRGQTDLVVLPEMFTTGFSMNSHALAENILGETISTVKRWAKNYDLALCGSFIAEDEGGFYNRGFFISPDQELYYDKKHLFRMGDERSAFKSGSERLIVEHKGFSICLLICYDLRFPVWSRNIENAYDLLVYVASWPESRAMVWDTLLKARALENQSYVCGVNRVGLDGLKLTYRGGSVMLDAKGRSLSSLKDRAEGVETIEISKEELDDFRQKFPVWMDADKFQITNDEI